MSRSPTLVLLLCAVMWYIESHSPHIMPISSTVHVKGIPNIMIPVPLPGIEMVTRVKTKVESDREFVHISAATIEIH